MAFYITPPGGNIALQKLTHFAVKRLEFLCQIFLSGGDRMMLHDIVLAERTVEDSECLIEGSLKDRISHFILRLAFAENRELRDFLVSAETLLFDFRFSSMSKDELYKCLRSVDQQCRHLEYFSHHMQWILKIFSDIRTGHHSWKRLVHKYHNGDEEDFLHVPFQSVFRLVAKREVLLNDGIARVPVCKLRELVTSLFSQMMMIGVQEAVDAAKTSEEDERFLMLYKHLRGLFYRRCGNHHLSKTAPWDLTHEDINRNVYWFPPCMSQLHRALRQQHRLKHHARIQYTLFLKEAGLPVHEAIMFWRKEYSQSSNSLNGCCHTWSEDERRYTYNIRHLYGLEGSRINYRGHSCKALQAAYVGANCEGGCPFSHSDARHLKELMETEGVHVNQLEILKLSSQGRCSEACQVYLEEKIMSHHQHLSRTALNMSEGINIKTRRNFICLKGCATLPRADMFSECVLNNELNLKSKGGTCVGTKYCKTHSDMVDKTSCNRETNGSNCDKGIKVRKSSHLDFETGISPSSSQRFTNCYTVSVVEENSSMTDVITNSTKKNCDEQRVADKTDDSLELESDFPKCGFQNGLMEDLKYGSDMHSEEVVETCLSNKGIVNESSGIRDRLLNSEKHKRFESLIIDKGMLSCSSKPMDYFLYFKNSVSQAQTEPVLHYQ